MNIKYLLLQITEKILIKLITIKIKLLTCEGPTFGLKNKTIVVFAVVVVFGGGSGPGGGGGVWW